MAATAGSGRRALVRAPLVSPANFLLATRDSGYRSTAQAIAEFIDNSIQAGASSAAIDIVPVRDRDQLVEITVTDDGSGMDATTLASALAFGGSSRFGDRSSLGRYGMGLPNGALSRARRVEVLTWRRHTLLNAYLDLDEIASGGSRSVRTLETRRRPPFVPRTSHGTVVRLVKCDRLEYRRVSTIVSHMKEDLGRIYRRYLARGFDLRVNGESVARIDPLLLDHAPSRGGVRQFGDTLTYRLVGSAGPGTVCVRFSELPVDMWHDLSAEEKRRKGVTNAPCVSVLRADREIDRGWYFMGSKRRENYDDWWRCEIAFDPALDELFGITHSKQTITPSSDLLDALAPDLEPIARALNSRVRQSFERVKLSHPLSAAERQAARASTALPPLQNRRERISAEIRDLLDQQTPMSKDTVAPYRILITELKSTAAFDVAVYRGQLFLLLNASHPLYRDLYGPLAISDSVKEQEVAKRVVLTVLAAARAEAGASRTTQRVEVRRFRQTWADVLATFFAA